MKKKLAGYSIDKLWEGEIDERRTAYLKAKKDDRVIDIIVVIQDELPKYFKRIDYFDEDADRHLDSLKMKIYKAAQGWKQIGITRENKTGLAFVNAKYNDILAKMKDVRAGEKK